MIHPESTGIAFMRAAYREDDEAAEALVESVKDEPLTSTAAWLACMCVGLLEERGDDVALALTYLALSERGGLRDHNAPKDSGGES